MIDATTLPTVLVLCCLGAAGVVAVLVYKGKIDTKKAALIWASAAAVLGVLWAGWRAGRKERPTSPNSTVDTLPKPIAADLAKQQVVAQTEKGITEIEKAEHDPDELKRLRRLSQP
jgi:membrane protein implicated in regulation of membrane protease activity